jgi:hypothetical protein
MSADLLVIGTGSLARAVCHAIAGAADQPLTVAVAGRDRAKADEAAYLAGTRAAVAGRPVRFTSHRAELSDGEQLDELLASTAPRLVLQCASPHSPWEGRAAPSAWTQFVARAGFGVTLPLQARFPVATAEALRRSGSAAPLVNACFPDAVNPVLAGLGLPVLCGVGNVQTLAASLRHALGPGDLRVLAHHAHLHAPADPADEARAWLDGVPVPEVGKLLAPQRAANRYELNQVTGFVAAGLLLALLAGRDVAANLPGPLGLPGGYPVRISAGHLKLDLPPGVDEAAAVAFNLGAAAHDGIDHASGSVRFAPATAARLAAEVPELADGFTFADVVVAADRLLAARERLRGA